MSEPWYLYKKHPAYVFGYHGCDASVGETVLAGTSALEASKNNYDWLGQGIYFWESNPARALEFATDAANDKKKSTKGKIKTPFVLGAIIDLGYCCNLFDNESLEELRTAHDAAIAIFSAAQVTIPKNTLGPDKVLRYLDKVVIDTMHALREQEQLVAYDSVRCAFSEGGELYPGSMISARSHVQIAILNPACIKGYFRPSM